MIDHATAATLRLVGLLGLGISLFAWAWAERSDRRKMLVLLSADVALLFAFIYYVGVMAVADTGARRVVPFLP